MTLTAPKNSTLQSHSNTTSLSQMVQACWRGTSPKDAGDMWLVSWLFRHTSLKIWWEFQTLCYPFTHTNVSRLKRWNNANQSHLALHAPSVKFLCSDECRSMSVSLNDFAIMPLTTSCRLILTYVMVLLCIVRKGRSWVECLRYRCAFNFFTNLLHSLQFFSVSISCLISSTWIICVRFSQLSIIAHITDSYQPHFCVLSSLVLISLWYMVSKKQTTCW